MHGHASAVLLAPDDIERLEETIAGLADNDLVQQLAKAEADVAAGRIDEGEQVIRVLAAAPRSDVYRTP